MNEIWKAALTERGDKAFELLLYNLGKTKIELISNEAIESNDFSKLKLKPIDQLIAIDIERYGIENAKWMYEVEVMGCGYFVQCDYLPKEELQYPECWRRKLYANIPLNYKWSEKGVPVQWVCGDIVKDITNFEIIDVVNFEAAGLIDGEQHFFHFESQLRHPFPPTKELVI